MTKKTILYVHSSNELYGSDRSLLKIIAALDKTQYVPVVVLPNDLSYQNELSDALEDEGVLVYQMKMGVLRRQYFASWRIVLFVFYTLWGIWRFQKIIHHHRVRLIYSNTSAVMNGALAARLHKVTHIWHIREIAVEPRWFIALLHRFIRANATQIVCNSHAVAEHLGLKPGVAPSFNVIWNGVDTQLFYPDPPHDFWRDQWHADDTTVCFGVVGRVSAAKGHVDFIKAAHRVVQQIPDSRFVIVGNPIPQQDIFLENLQQLVIELDLQAHVFFVPFVDDIPRIMQSLDVLVLPSVVPEPFGRVVVEAMASGRAVIASNHGGVTEIVVQQETGLLYTPFSVKDLAQAMCQLAQDEVLRQQMGQAGHQRVLNYFDEKIISQQFATLYEDVLS